ncbi:unnamed protein product [Didymodactylos carnosus]|uniref:Methyltransferase type 11 domain-containing protein n=1 Tax=Didymodactylos carnosus TaxID=1234261 RepID=A0A814RCK9_9BILA|nr:unnamed protein product [Didymodactylos carnosus]CAF1187253.1 unnamed protein product [Didymodactylos carnosus]CAF3895663.1 unnamed protein product [Didymodactylos carnosus]CAF3998220.1 unnamed protein product [Didymodactylos carnosus]
MKDVESNSIDTIIMTFVLCSAPDPLPEQLLIEAHRVLKSGGELHLLDHVLSDPNVKPMTNLFQKLVNPLWAIIDDVCRFKPIVNYLNQMKTTYSKVDYQNIGVPVPFFLISDAIKGVLTK